MYDEIPTTKAEGTPALIRITERIEKITYAINECAEQLEQHATRVHGESPRIADGGRSEQPVRVGALGSLEDVVDRLDESLSVLDCATRRNCNLA